ncbi:MAG: sulfurtransferase [Deltaproteobacteria bacterium]|nr:sulfurtransferase [Deltaproteobacteria bacterium]
MKNSKEQKKGSSFKHPEYLVETDWLAEHLNDPNLRILDCTVFLHADKTRGYRVESGYQKWQEGHIPGSGFADLTKELSDPHGRFMFTMPSAERFAEAMSRYGVSNGNHVVLYDSLMNIWSARVWWMLRTFGFDNAAVLNGGWRKWRKEERPVSTTATKYPFGHFVPHPRPQLIAQKQDVVAAIGNGTTCIVNALTAEEHAGKGQTRYKRPGRIKSSVNVPFMTLVDPETHAYLPADKLRTRFTEVGALNRKHVVTYCGGGIAACSDAFVLTLLGIENVAIYDGSLTEWTEDPETPMEID